MRHPFVVALALAVLGVGCSGPVTETVTPEPVAVAKSPSEGGAGVPTTLPFENGVPATDRAASSTGSKLEATEESPMESTETPAAAGREFASFGAGCFWCTEAVLEQLDGVVDVASGYMGGVVANPTYEQVCTGRTGHAEIVRVTFEPAKISYEHLIEWFWKLHDPTTLNRQGNDVGTQYRSVIFCHSDAQRVVAEASKARAQQQFLAPIVTEISPASTFYPAEEYHQDFYKGNRQYGYCRAIIAPKLDKLGLKK